MKLFFQLLFLLATLSTASCELNTQKENKNLIPLDVPSQKIEKFSELFSELDYLIFPSNATVAKIDKAQKFEGYFIFGDFDITKSISIIDSNFNNSKNIRNFGQGPGEYTTILDFTINKTNRSVDILTLNRLISYDFNGQFIKEAKLPGSVGKIVHVEKDNYVIYREKSIHPNFPGPDEKSILWSWNRKTNEVLRIPCGSENVKFPFFMERNNLNYQNNKIIFSANFLDTVYVFNDALKLEEKRYFSGNREYMPFNLITEYEGSFPSEIASKYYFHLPNDNLTPY